MLVIVFTLHGSHHNPDLQCLALFRDRSSVTPPERSAISEGRSFKSCSFACARTQLNERNLSAHCPPRTSSWFPPVPYFRP